VSEPVDLAKRWPSSYANGGQVAWSTTIADKDGRLDVSFPHVKCVELTFCCICAAKFRFSRWAHLRATEGWATLQHHAVLRSLLTIHPPSLLAEDAPPVPQLLVDLVQGSFFTIVPFDTPSRSAPKWYAGNIYDIERALSQSILLHHVSSTSPTKYYLYVAGDYEIRLFGDPLVMGSPTPVQKLQITAALEMPSNVVKGVPGHHVAPDFVGRWAFGSAFGVGLRSAGEWWTVIDIQSSLPEMEFSLPSKSFRIAPTQTRILPLRLKQRGPITATQLTLHIDLQSGAPWSRARTFVQLDLNHVHNFTDTSAIKASYFFVHDMPTMFYAIPPTEAFSQEGKPTPPLLAVHGAGVDILSTKLWQDALPRQKRSWVVVPSGRTSWVRCSPGQTGGY
jgi:hypothetical protein